MRKYSIFLPYFQRKILSLSQIKEKSNGNKDLNRLKLVLVELKKTENDWLEKSVKIQLQFLVKCVAELDAIFAHLYGLK